MHIKKSHHNKAVKFKIFNDAKQPKLMFPVAKGDNPDNPKAKVQISTAIESYDFDNGASTSVDESTTYHKSG